MNIRRRSLLTGVAGLAAAARSRLLASPASAQEAYPSRLIRLLCAFPPAGGADVVVRWYADKLGKLASQTVIVENKPGAGGNIATEFVARSKPDGYTIYFHTGSSVSANMHLFKKPPINAATDLSVAATINKQGFLLVVDPKSPHKTLPELTAVLKQKGDKASYATSNTSGKVVGELYKRIAGVSSVEVSYRSGPDALNDIASGAVDYAVLDPIFVFAQIREGRMRPLAVATGERLKSQPDIPTFAESGVPGIDLTGWFAAMVPSATPRPIIDQINTWLNQITATDEARAFLNGFGSDPWISTPEEGQKRLVSEIQQWGKYVELAKLPQQ
jgi:tripartite-type tricarboxylate transporter receptor subunit TctC